MLAIGSATTAGTGGAARDRIPRSRTRCPEPGRAGLVIGAGPIGLACLEFLKLHDIELVVMRPLTTAARVLPRAIGIEHTIAVSDDGDQLAELESITGGQLADLVIDATGSARSMSTCFERRHFGGRVIYVGVASNTTCSSPTRRSSTVASSRLMASRNARSADFRENHQILSEKKIDLAPWMTHRHRDRGSPGKIRLDHPA